MTPKDFPERNKFYKQPSEDGFNLYVHDDGKQLISCFEMTNDEKLLGAFFGNVWLCVIGQIQPPVWITTRNPFYDPNQPITPDEKIIDNFIERKITLFMKNEFANFEFGKYESPDKDDYVNLLRQFTDFLFDRFKLECHENCGHSAEEHSAFDMGYHAGRRGREIENPFTDSLTNEAWENGYSVGKLTYEGE